MVTPTPMAILMALENPLVIAAERKGGGGGGGGGGYALIIATPSKEIAISLTADNAILIAAIITFNSAITSRCLGALPIVTEIEPTGAALHSHIITVRAASSAAREGATLQSRGS